MSRGLGKPGLSLVLKMSTNAVTRILRENNIYSQARTTSKKVSSQARTSSSISLLRTPWKLKSKGTIDKRALY